MGIGSVALENDPVELIAAGPGLDPFAQLFGLRESCSIGTGGKGESIRSGERILEGIGGRGEFMVMVLRASRRCAQPSLAANFVRLLRLR